MTISQRFLNEGAATTEDGPKYFSKNEVLGGDEIFLFEEKKEILEIGL